MMQSDLSYNGMEFDEKSCRIMNRFAKKVLASKDAYLKKLGDVKREKIRQMHVDLVSIVLLAYFDDQIKTKKIGGKVSSVLSVSDFYKKLVALKVKRTAVEHPLLTSFLALKHSQTKNVKKDDETDASKAAAGNSEAAQAIENTTYIDVKKLATAIGEFLKSEYLQSFGTQKSK